MSFRVRIAILGDGGVGKTSFVHRAAFGNDKDLPEDLSKERTVQTFNVTHKGVPVEVTLYEIPCFSAKGWMDAETEATVKATNVQLIMFSHDNVDSCKSLRQTQTAVAGVCGTFGVIFVGNKADKLNSSDKTGLVSESDFRPVVSSSYLSKYLEVSAKSGSGVKAAVGTAIEVTWDALIPQGSARASFKMQLHVNLQRGVVLDAQDSNGLADPYIKVKKGSKLLWTSSAQKKTLKPEWNQIVEVDGAGTLGEKADIVFELWDKDTILDDFVGTYSTPFDIAPGGIDVAEYEFLDKKKKPVAKIHLGWYFFPKY